MNDKIIKEIARITAHYSRLAREVDVYPKKEFNNREWIKEEYESLKNISPKNSLDKLVKENIGFFEEIVEKFSNLKVPGKHIPNHSDIHQYNILFEKNEAKCLIDFDNINIAPKVEEITSPISKFVYNDKKEKIDSKRYHMFIEEYEKIFPLTKKEKESIVPLMLIRLCIGFWWHYKIRKKKPELKEKSIRETIQRSKAFYEFWKNGN